MDDEHIAKASGWNLPVSRKFSVETANFIRGRDLEVAKELMEGVIAKKVAVPLKKYNRDQAHKRGKIAAGRYPVNVAKEILRLLESAEMNALNKGLDADVLYISGIIVNKGTGTMRHSRHRGREAKRAHIEIVLEEREKAKKKVKKKEAPKVEKKPEVKKEEPKKEEPKVEKKPEVKKEEPKKEEPRVEKKPEVKKEEPKSEKND